MEANESVVDNGDFDDPGNKEIFANSSKDWSTIPNDSAMESTELGVDCISGSDVNLQNAALQGDLSVLSDNTSLSDECLANQTNNVGFQQVVNNKHKFKRSNNVLSPVQQVNRKQIRLSDNNSLTNLAFVKGKHENIANLNSISLKEALFKVDHSLKPEQLKYVKDSLRISCINVEQKNKILEISTLMGIEIETSSHYALNRQSIDYKAVERVIIFGVSVDITEEQVCNETGAISSKRLQKKMKQVLHDHQQKQSFYHTIIPLHP